MVTKTIWNWLLCACCAISLTGCAMNELEKELLNRDAQPDMTIQKAMDWLNQSIAPVKTLPFNAIKDIYKQNNNPMSPMREEQYRYGLGGFRLKGDPNIYVNEASDTYGRAKKGKPAGIAEMASVLAHEQVHGTETGREGEFPAHRLQSDYLRSQLEKMPTGSQRKSLEDYMRLIEDKAQMYDPKRWK